MAAKQEPKPTKSLDEIIQESGHNSDVERLEKAVQDKVKSGEKK